MKYSTKLRKHFKTVCAHKYYVFLASIEAGIPFRGFMHDWSKFSFSEFFNSAKYYTGNRSPIDNEKDEKGYSYAWLHHRGRNPHHWEYWVDNLSSGGEALKMPIKYVKEMICDWIGAGKAYDFDNWNYDTPFKRFNSLYNSGKLKLHLDTYKFLFHVLQEYGLGRYKLKDIIKKYEEKY